MIAERSRNVARLFAGRIYVRSGKIFIVNGSPDPEILFKCLCLINEVPDYEKEPDPLKLGFSAPDIRPVGNKELNDWSQALLKWQKIDRMMDSGKRHKSENKKKLKKWKNEIEYLEQRRDLLFALRSQKSISEISETKWIPSDSDVIRINEAFAEIDPGTVLPHLWKWFASITWWIGGKVSFLRFINALSKVGPTRNEYEIQLCIEKLHKKFRNLQKDLEHDSNQTVFLHVKDLLGNLPPDILNKIKIKAPRRIRAIGEYLRQQIPYIERIYEGVLRIDPENIAVCSVITSLDGSKSAFPFKILKIPIHNKTEFINTFLKLSTQNHYQNLLKALDKIQTSIYNSENVKCILNMLDAGADAVDINWLFHQESGIYTVREFGNKKLSPGSLHLITTVLEKYGEEICKDDEITYVLERLVSSGSTWFIDTFSEWLIRIPKRYWDRKTARAAWNSMLSGLALNELEDSGSSILHLWAHPLKQKLNLDTSGELSAETRMRLRNLLYYQKLLGRGAVLPTSLTKLLIPKQKNNLESDTIRNLKSDGIIAYTASTSLSKLENQEKANTEKIALHDRKIRRKAEEISARLALEVLSQIIKTSLIRYFKERFVAPPPDWLRLHELLDIIKWEQSLQDKMKEVFDELVTAWKNSGPYYKFDLSINKDWINKASERGLNIEKWLNPEVTKCRISDKEMTIEIARDPFRIFLMGSYFDTCLGIRDGSNRDSVLANAYDANKAVIFIIDENGVVKARKLLGVSDDGALVGYRTYINSDIEKEREIIKEKITSYCINLASLTRLRLVNNVGRIKSLTGLFWYDDHSEDWEIENSFDVNIPDDNSDQNIKASHILFLANKHNTYLQEIMSQIGLCFPTEEDSIKKLFQECPAFIEEALIFGAREAQDVTLINDLTDCCQTISGKLEAMLGRFVLTGSELPDHIISDTSGIICSRVDATLCKIDTVSSIQMIFNRSLQSSDHGNKEVLFPLLWKSKKSAASLIDFLIKESVWYANSSELFIIIHFLRIHFPGKLPNVLINNVLTHHNSNLDGGITGKEIFSMSQWLPLLKNPNTFLSMKFLVNEYNDRDEFSGTLSEYILKNRLAIIIWAMRNKCSVSIKFLKELCETVPSALLAFSLISVPYRFQDFITKTAMENIKSPASLMALLAVHGELKTKEILDDTGSLSNPEKDLKFYHIVSIYKAYQTLSWKDIRYQIQNLNVNERLECLPLLVYHVHKALSESVDGGFGRVNTEEEIMGVLNSCLDVNGLLFCLTDRLRICEDPNMQFSLRRFIHQLMNGQPYFPAKIRLWLNIISNDRLYVDVNEEFIEKTIKFDYDFDITDPFDLFFDSTGKHRPTADLIWSGDPGDLPTNFPDGMDNACVFADFLRSKNAKPKFATEIHRKLFENGCKK